MANLKFYRGAAPADAEEGAVLFSTADSVIKVFNGTGWEPYGGKVLDVTYDSAKNELTLTKPDGSTEKVALKSYTAGEGISISETNEISALDEKLGVDLTVTNATGALNAGTKVSADTTLKALLKKMLQQVKQPGTPTAPKLTVTLTNAGAKEVGTKITPAYTTNFNAGSYTYGPATGVTATGYSVSDGTTEKNTDKGSFEEITVGDSTNYKLTATATYSDGAVANDNTGAKSSPEVKISAGTTATATSSAITGFRSFFYGTKATGLEAYDSAAVRALTNANSAATSGKKFSITIAAGTKQVVIAVPAARSLKSVINVGLSRGEVADTFVASTVDVEGANGYAAASYKVYVFNSSTALDANTYEVTLA